jgi:transcriptional regulator with XRE-family HTH domain
MHSPFGPHFTEKKGYPTDPKTIGEMIRKRRLDLGLRQIDAAKMIGCDEMSVVNWEKGTALRGLLLKKKLTRCDCIAYSLDFEIAQSPGPFSFDYISPQDTAKIPQPLRKVG